MWPPSAYNHRRRWRAFAEAWDAAVETGYAHLESALVERGLNLFSDDAPGVPDGPLPDMTAAQAIHLLHMHKHHVHGVGQGPHTRLLSPLDEAAANLEKAIRVVMGRDALDPVKKAREERAWALRRHSGQARRRLDPRSG